MEFDAGFIQDLLPLGVFAAIFIIALVGSYFNLKKRKKLMKEVAARLGLEYSETDTLAFLGRDKRVRPAYRGQGGSGFDLQGLIKDIMTVFAPWRVSGKFNGYQVVIRTEKKDKKTLTVVQLLFGRPLEMGLNIAAKNILSRLGGNILGRQPISSGNTELDGKVYISGQDEMKIKYLVKRSEFQQMLLALYSKYPGVRIDDQGLTYQQNKVISDLAGYQALLAALSGAAKAFAE